MLPSPSPSPTFHPSPSPSTPPLLYVDIAVTPTLTERIPVWAHSDCGQLAAAFTAAHGLSTKMAGRLAGMLEKQRAAVLAKQALDGQSMLQASGSVAARSQ